MPESDPDLRRSDEIQEMIPDSLRARWEVAPKGLGYWAAAVGAVLGAFAVLLIVDVVTDVPTGTWGIGVFLGGLAIIRFLVRRWERQRFEDLRAHFEDVPERAPQPEPDPQTRAS